MFPQLNLDSSWLLYGALTLLPFVGGLFGLVFSVLKRHRFRAAVFLGIIMLMTGGAVAAYESEHNGDLPSNIYEIQQVPESVKNVVVNAAGSLQSTASRAVDSGESVTAGATPEPTATPLVTVNWQAAHPPVAVLVIPPLVFDPPYVTVTCEDRASEYGDVKEVRVKRRFYDRYLEHDGHTKALAYLACQELNERAKYQAILKQNHDVENGIRNEYQTERRELVDEANRLTNEADRGYLAEVEAINAQIALLDAEHDRVIGEMQEEIRPVVDAYMAFLAKGALE